MTLLNKILLILLGITVIGAIGFIIYDRHENSLKLDAINQSMVEQKLLIDGIVRSQSQWTTKEDMNKFITDNGVNLKAIQSDLDKLNASVAAVNVLIVTSSSQHSVNVPSTDTGPTNPNPVDPGNPDPFGYAKKQQDLVISEDFGAVKVPIGSVGFSAWQEKPWSIDIKAREYSVDSVIGTDENQKMYVYNKFNLKIDGKTYDVPIKSATTKQEYPESKWSWWNPKLAMTAGGAVNFSKIPIEGSANAGVVLGIMSYGKFKNSPDISVLQLGAAYQTGTQKPSVIINPVSFNIGHLVNTTVIDNTYLGPSVQLDTGGNIFGGANLSIGF